MTKCKKGRHRCTTPKHLITSFASAECINKFSRQKQYFLKKRKRKNGTSLRFYILHFTVWNASNIIRHPLHQSYKILFPASSRYIVKNVSISLTRIGQWIFNFGSVKGRLAQQQLSPFGGALILFRWVTWARNWESIDSIEGEKGSKP